MNWWNWLEKILGLGVIPPEWKQRIYGFLLALVALVELWVEIPDAWHTEAMLTRAALAIAVIIALVFKLVRERLQQV